MPAYPRITISLLQEAKHLSHRPEERIVLLVLCCVEIASLGRNLPEFVHAANHIQALVA